MDHRAKRLERRQKKEEAKSTEVGRSDVEQPGHTTSDEKFAKLLTQNEDVLLNFVAKINKVCYSSKFSNTFL